MFYTLTILHLSRDYSVYSILLGLVILYGLDSIPPVNAVHYNTLNPHTKGTSQVMIHDNSEMFTFDQSEVWPSKKSDQIQLWYLWYKSLG